MAGPSPVYLRITNQDSLRIIAFDNPHKKNAIAPATYVGLTAAINEAATDDTVKVLALTGIGDFFSSGNDVGNLNGISDIAAYADYGVVISRKMLHAFLRFPKLFVAVVNGPCIGIAAVLVALCDVVYASETVSGSSKFS